MAEIGILEAGTIRPVDESSGEVNVRRYAMMAVLTVYAMSNIGRTSGILPK